MLQAGDTAQQRTLRAIPVRESDTGESSAGNPRGQLQDPRKHPTPRNHLAIVQEERRFLADEIGVSEGDPHYDEISIQA